MEERDAEKVLLLLRSYALGPDDSKQGRYVLDAKDFKSIRLSSSRFNVAVELLSTRSLVDAEKSRGRYSQVCLTERGRQRADELLSPSGVPLSEHTTATSTRYLICELLGKGTKGDVWYGKDTLLNRDIAVKFVDSTQAGQDALAHARALAHVAHPNVVTVYEIATLNHPEKKTSADAILMELVKGVTLTERLGNSMDTEEAFRISKELITGIEAYHKQGLAHLDVHDDNVLISTSGVKILDPIYYETKAFQSTATRETQQRRDIQGVRDLIIQMIALSKVTVEKAMEFHTRTIKPSLANIATEIDKVFSSPTTGDDASTNFLLSPNLDDVEIRRLTLVRKYEIARDALDSALKSRDLILESISTMTTLTRMVTVLGAERAPESSWKPVLEGVRRNLSDMSQEVEKVSRGIRISWDSTQNPLAPLKREIEYIHAVSLFPIAAISLDRITLMFSNNETQLNAFRAMNDVRGSLAELRVHMEREVSAVEEWALPFLGRSK